MQLFEYTLTIRTSLPNTIAMLVEDIEDLILEKSLSYESRLVEIESIIREGKSTKRI